MKDNQKGNVINIGDFRFTRGSTNSYGFKSPDCQHNHTTLDSNGGIITCDDCNKQLSPFWVIEYVIGKWDEWCRQLQSRATEVKALEGKVVILKAAKAIEKVWRRGMAPSCPHCRAAILPEDGLAVRGSSVSFEYEHARRKRGQSSDKPTATDFGGGIAE